MSVMLSPGEIISKATETPGVYTFSDLLENPTIQTLDKNSKLAKVLHIFCYGTYPEYKSAGLPDLSPSQLRKLRQLTIISACDRRRYIPYDVLLENLELNSLRDLEDLVIELFYFDALSGKLDQQKRVIVVEASIGRDFRQDDLPQLKALLDAWSARVESILNEVAQQVTNATTLKNEWIGNRSRLAELELSSKNEENKSDMESVLMDIDDQLEIHPGGAGPSPLQRPSVGEKGPLRNLLKSRRSGK